MAERDLRQVAMNEAELRGFLYALHCIDTWARQMQGNCDRACLSRPGTDTACDFMRTTPEAMQATRFMAQALTRCPPGVV